MIGFIASNINFRLLILWYEKAKDEFGPALQ
jgi:hypothetical protein